MSMLSNLKQKYGALRPDQQHQAMIAMIIGGIAVFACLAFFVHSSKAPPAVSVNVGVPPGKSVLSVDDKLLEKSVTLQSGQTNKDVDDLKKRVDLMQKGGVLPQNGAAPGQQPNPLAVAPATGVPVATPSAQGKPGVAQLDQIINQRNGQGAAAPGQTSSAAPISMPMGANKKQRALPPLPVPVNQNLMLGQSYSAPPPPGGNSGPYYQQGSKETRPPRGGKISVAVNEMKDSPKSGSAEDASKKKEPKRTVYLPPSFMEATLLSGLNAPTSDAGRNNPVPVLIRIAAPAVLPNEVRANLKGCFVVGEAVGSLSDERAHCRLVSISCISRKGQAVIDQEINGFVQDADGGIGLTGRVVSKMGAAVARLAAVGVLQGIGNGLGASATSSTVSALGQVTSLGTSMKDLGMSAAGGGIANASKGLAKIYEDLTLGSLPVIEVGNGKKITLVVTKGVLLEIKNYKIVPMF